MISDTTLNYLISKRLLILFLNFFSIFDIKSNNSTKDFVNTSLIYSTSRCNVRLKLFEIELVFPRFPSCTNYITSVQSHSHISDLWTQYKSKVIGDIQKHISIQNTR